MHIDERCIMPIHAFSNDIIGMHDISPFKATQFAPLLNDFWKKFPGDFWQDTELGCQAVCEDFANGVIKGTHSLWSHEFILRVYNELLLDQGKCTEA
jgi:hypothetical protein